MIKTSSDIHMCWRKKDLLSEKAPDMIAKKRAMIDIQKPILYGI
jgi:hypothetical protein